VHEGFLHKYFLNNGGLRLHKWAHYFDIYEMHFQRFVGKSPVMLKIGVSGGGSLWMWKEYFGEGAQIIGLDIKPECMRYAGEGVDVIIGSQSDEKVLSEIVEKYPRIDIVLDDGSHRNADIRASFDFLYDKIHPNGVYFIEDLHACYWKKFGGGVGQDGSFMEFVKDRLDDLNAVHTDGELPISDFTAATRSICVYDSVVVFEKKPQGLRFHRRTMAMPREPKSPD